MHVFLVVAVLLQASPNKAATCQPLAPKIIKAMHLDEALKAEFAGDPKATEKIQAALAQTCATRSDAEIKCLADAKPEAVTSCEWVLSSAAQAMSAFEKEYSARMLPAAPPAGTSKVERCKLAYSSLVLALHMKEAAAKDPKMGPDFVSGTEALFAPDCARLEDLEIACVFGKGQAELSACTGAMQAFMGAAQRYVMQKDPQAFARYRKAGMQSEAKTNLRALSTVLRALQDEDPAKVAKLTKLPAFPEGDCCKTADKKCKLDRAVFEKTAWKELSWVPEDGVRYHYSLTRTSPTALVLRAEGDPTCEGQPERWEVNVVLAPEVKIDLPHLVP